MDNDRGSTELKALEGGPEDWIQELLQAGWKQKNAFTFFSPGGIMFPGPALALRKKRTHPQLAYLTMEDLQDTRYVR